MTRRALAEVTAWIVLAVLASWFAYAVWVTIEEVLR